MSPALGNQRRIILTPTHVWFVLSFGGAYVVLCRQRSQIDILVYT